jgi:hypothetical protein
VGPGVKDMVARRSSVGAWSLIFAHRPLVWQPDGQVAVHRPDCFEQHG